MQRLNWPAILGKAGAIVESYDTSVTLRQLFYRLVAAQILPNTRAASSTLSARTVEALRQRTFPALADRTRSIHRHRTLESPEDARQWLASVYRHDRNEGQDWAVYLGIEKHGIISQLVVWFTNLGVRIFALGGYSSQTYVDDIAEDAMKDGRPAALLYAGDFDPSGEDIERDLLARCDVFSQVVLVGRIEKKSQVRFGTDGYISQGEQ